MESFKGPQDESLRCRAGMLQNLPPCSEFSLASPPLGILKLDCSTSRSISRSIPPFRESNFV